MPSGPPRAYERPYSIPEVIAAEAANQKLQDGELLNGRQSRAAIGSSDKTGGEASGKQATDGTPQDTAALYFEFFEVAPPTLPEKDIPIR